MIINSPIRVIIPPVIIYKFSIWPGNKNHAKTDAINGSPKGIDATMLGLIYFTR